MVIEGLSVESHGAEITERLEVENQQRGIRSSLPRSLRVVTRTYSVTLEVKLKSLGSVPAPQSPKHYVAPFLVTIYQSF